MCLFLILLLLLAHPVRPSDESVLWRTFVRAVIGEVRRPHSLLFLVCAKLGVRLRARCDDASSNDCSAVSLSLSLGEDDDSPTNCERRASRAVGVRVSLALCVTKACDLPNLDSVCSIVFLFCSFAVEPRHSRRTSRLVAMSRSTPFWRQVVSVRWPVRWQGARQRCLCCNVRLERDNVCYVRCQPRRSHHGRVVVV